MPISGPDTLSHTYRPGPSSPPSLPPLPHRPQHKPTPRHAEAHSRRNRHASVSRARTTTEHLQNRPKQHVTAKYDSGLRRVPGQGSPFASSGKDRGNTCTSERYDLIVSDVSALLDGSAWAKSRTSQTNNFPEDFVFLCLWPAP